MHLTGGEAGSAPTWERILSQRKEGSSGEQVQGLYGLCLACQFQSLDLILQAKGLTHYVWPVGQIQSSGHFYQVLLEHSPVYLFAHCTWLWQRCTGRIGRLTELKILTLWPVQKRFAIPDVGKGKLLKGFNQEGVVLRSVWQEAHCGNWVEHGLGITETGRAVTKEVGEEGTGRDYSRKDDHFFKINF